jgi:hypothetical protein
MRPVAVVVASDVTADDARELERLASEQATKVIHLGSAVPRAPIAVRRARP